MPPKKTPGATATKKASGTASHASYKDMIKEAILSLKDRQGSSRQALKKYVRANNKISTTSEAAFDSLFNKALKTGVEKGDFTQPKGPSGPVKLAKKESKPAEKKAPAVKKEAKSKTATTKKTTTKKADGKPATKKASTVKKASTKVKANTAKPRSKTTKTEAPAPAVQDTPTVLKKTKSGRVSKQKAPATKKAAPKKAAAPKKKTTTVKKAEASS